VANTLQWVMDITLFIVLFIVSYVIIHCIIHCIVFHYWKCSAQDKVPAYIVKSCANLKKKRLHTCQAAAQRVKLVQFARALHALQACAARRAALHADWGSMLASTPVLHTNACSRHSCEKA
jgi:hypothetical protein